MIPMLYVVFQWLRERVGGAPEAATGPEPAKPATAEPAGKI